MDLAAFDDVLKQFNESDSFVQLKMIVQRNFYQLLVITGCSITVLEYLDNVLLASCFVSYQPGVCAEGLDNFVLIHLISKSLRLHDAFH